jgi:hypothetical protein
VSETHPQTRSDRAAWWHARRLKIAVAIAVVEGIYVAVASDFSRWTVIIISAPIIAFYIFAGRTLESPTAREIAWIAAASQALTVLLCVVAKLIGTFSLILAGVFAAVVLILLVGEKPGKTGGKA